MNENDFGRILKQLRKQRGLTQDQLSERSGVPQPTISRLERGVHRNPDLATAMALARALGVTVSQMLGEIPLETDTDAYQVLLAMQRMSPYRKADLARISRTLAEASSKKIE